MRRYRSRPLEIRADRWLHFSRPPPGVCLKTCDDHAYRPTGTPHCHSKNGLVLVSLGDFVIEEIDGTGFYPCAPDVFLAKYEPIDGGGRS